MHCHRNWLIGWDIKPLNQKHRLFYLKMCLGDDRAVRITALSGFSASECRAQSSVRNFTSSIELAPVALHQLHMWLETLQLPLVLRSSLISLTPQSSQVSVCVLWRNQRWLIFCARLTLILNLKQTFYLGFQSESYRRTLWGFFALFLL